MKSIFRERPSAEILRERTAGWRQLQVWLPVAIALTVIAFESSNTFSSEHTSGWLRPFVERIFGHINDTLWGVLHYSVRKCGHFTGYGMVCLTFLRAWLLTLGRDARVSTKQWRMRSCSLAVLATFLVASLDEWHQTFIPSRTGAFTDVLIDTSGGLLACALVTLIFWRARRTPVREAINVKAPA